MVDLIRSDDFPIAEAGHAERESFDVPRPQFSPLPVVVVGSFRLLLLLAVMFSLMVHAAASFNKSGTAGRRARL